MLKINVKEIIEATGAKLLCGNENSFIEGATTNSRQIKKNDLFVPIIGERVDGHKFIVQALNDGASVSFTSQYNDDILEQMKADNLSDKTLLKVEDTLCALQAVAAYSRSRFSLPLVGITGSVGKTTTKEMVATALSSKFNTLKTEGNLNSQIGLSLMMLRFEENHEAAVIEMGVSENGEMTRLVNIAKPQYAIITNIGMSHISQFKKKENTRREKLNIINNFDENSVLFINANDELLYDIALYKEGKKDIDLSDDTRKALSRCNVVTFGTTKECDYRATDIISDELSTEFVMVHSSMRVKVKLSVPGMHNVINALAALSVSHVLGLDMLAVSEKLFKYHPIAMRGTIIDNGKYKIIDDTYNASPDSIKSGIDVLTGMKEAKRTYAVLADVLELGEESFNCHYDIGEYVAKSTVDELVTVGNESKAVAKAVIESGVNKVINSFDSNEQAIDYLKKNVLDGSVLLIKGSRGMHMDEVVKELSK